MCVPPVKKEYATLVTQRTKLTGMTTASSIARNIFNRDQVTVHERGRYPKGGNSFWISALESEYTDKVLALYISSWTNALTKYLFP
jgi:hypothetical protein